MDLTKRERDVLQAMARGLGNGAIASELCVAEQTVKFHVSNIHKKLGASNRLMAVVKAMETGLLPQPLIEAVVIDGVLFKRVDEEPTS